MCLCAKCAFRETNEFLFGDRRAATHQIKLRGRFPKRPRYKSKNRREVKLGKNDSNSVSNGPRMLQSGMTRIHHDKTYNKEKDRGPLDKFTLVKKLYHCCVPLFTIHHQSKLSYKIDGTRSQANGTESRHA